MLFIASILMEVLAVAMLALAGMSGYVTYRLYTELPTAERTASVIEVFIRHQQLQYGIAATISAIVLFLGFMVAFAVIDTARHTRKVLDQLQRMERV